MGHNHSLCGERMTEQKHEAQNLQTRRFCCKQVTTLWSHPAIVYTNFMVMLTPEDPPPRRSTGEEKIKLSQKLVENIF